MNAAANTGTIYDAASACADLFDRYLRNPRLTSSRRDLGEECRGRFNLWAAYVGAVAAPKASLDARLGLHSDIKDIFLDLLVMIKDNVQQGLSSLFMLINDLNAFWKSLLTPIQN
jgi:hypothetical protein